MEQWKGKVAVVTGASAGIGEAICKDLCNHDVIVVGMARRLDKLDQLKEDILANKEDAQFYPVKCDVTQESEIVEAFEYVVNELGGVDILVNNAGILQGTSFFDEDNLDRLNKLMNTNFTGLVSATKKAYKSMSDRDVPGYIINMSSVAGHSAPNVIGGKPIFNLYNSSKFALTALVKVMRYELNYFKKNKIRVSNVSPGAVSTEILEAGGVSNDDFCGEVEVPMLKSEDVSDVVIYLLGTNPRIQIEDVIIRPTGEMH